MTASLSRAEAYRACAVPAAICPAFVLPVDDPLDAAGPLTIAAFQPIHLLLRPGQLLKKKPARWREDKRRLHCIVFYIHTPSSVVYTIDAKRPPAPTVTKAPPYQAHIAGFAVLAARPGL